MYILQLSDLHLSASSNKEELIEKINSLGAMIRSLKKESNSQIVCCVLGDFVEQGEAAAFSLACELLGILKGELCSIFGTDNVEFILVPGNHDLCKIKRTESLSSYYKFASTFLDVNVDDISDKSIEKSNLFGYTFISINSVFGQQHQFGQIDFNNLKAVIDDQNTILLTHHALISSDDEDSASIRNGYSLLKLIEEKNVIALLHGHTHGCKRYSVGEDKQIIGVGPMFKQIEDISNQCNLIHVAGRFIRSISTLTYHADRNCWDCNDTYSRRYDNNYTGNSIFEVYSKVLEDANINYLLSNLRIEIKQKYDLFKSEIKTRFKDALEQAELWQKDRPPASLDYTHCQLMNADHQKWEDFIIETLKNNPTSKRAIIPLIAKEMVYAGGDEKLVSFDMVQFGFENEKCDNLMVTVYLRALEIRYFLPLNICETYIMAEAIRREFRNVNSITVCLFAFRGEAKDQYGCYRKSRLDILSESEIYKLLFQGQLDEIQRLLLEKIKMSDTVINNNWLVKIKNAVNAYYEEADKEPFLNQISLIEQDLENYKKARKSCSNYFSTKPQEEMLTQSIMQLVNLFGDKVDG